MRDEHSNGGEPSLSERVGYLESRMHDYEERFDKLLGAVEDQTQAVADNTKIVQTERSAWNLRVDEILGQVQLLQDKADTAVTRAGLAVDKSFAAIGGMRDQASLIGGLQGDQAGLRSRIDQIEKTVGKWPTSPDDTGSGLAGLAGRAALTSQTGLERIAEEALAKALAPPTPPASSPPIKKSTIPPELVSLWKRLSKNKKVATVIVTVIVLGASVVQTILAARGH